jgi:hypothetical protein
MNQPLKTEDDHKAAMKEFARLWELDDADPEKDRLDALATLITEYDDRVYPMGA